MAWQKLTYNDLAARMTTDEITAHSADGAFDADVVEKLLTQTVTTFRGYIASGRKCVMDTATDTLPGMLVNAALSFAIFDLIVRMGVEPSESRKTARTSAENLLSKIASGEIIPEDAEATTTPQAAQAPAFADATPERLLD